MTDNRSPFDFDSEEHRVFRVLGPPGTGKTSWLVDQSGRAAEKYGVASVIVLSMTRAASRHFAQRESPLPRDAVSTVHARCYRALGRPKLLESKDLVGWNEWRPQYALESIQDGMSADGVPRVSSYGDALLSELDLARALMRPVDEMRPELAAFARDWSEWKESCGVCDFTDLLERALAEVPILPGRPDVLMVDEGQDLSTLELAVIEQWSRGCAATVLVGDPDQSLYVWRGADRRVLLEDDNRPPFKILSRSHRVPAAVHERAMELIRRSETWSRAQYEPRGEAGEFGRIGHPFSAPAAVVDDLEREVLSNPLSDSAMLLATCGYMVAPVVAELRRRGIGYHNPYRNEWNPLARGSESRVTGSDRLLAFLRLRSPRDWRVVLGSLASERHGGALRHGAKARVEQLADDSSPATITEVLVDAVLPGALEMFEHAGVGPPPRAAVERFAAACTSTARDSMEFPLAVWRRDGERGLASPRVIVGTVHSVKGGEAEHVYLNLGISPAARRQLRSGGWSGADAIWRTFYVGATRAQHRLVLCGPGGELGIA